MNVSVQAGGMLSFIQMNSGLKSTQEKVQRQQKCASQVDFFEKQNLLKQCPITVLYESTIQHKKTLKQVRQQMKKDQVTIEKLYGRRGILEEKEYEKIKELKCS